MTGLFAHRDGQRAGDAGQRAARHEVRSAPRGVSSELCASFRVRGGRTVLDDIYCTSPLKVAKTFPVAPPVAASPAGGAETGGRAPSASFAPSGTGAAVTVMDVSPGLMDGDNYSLEWDVGEGCAVAVTTQSYAKAHPSPHVGARQRTRIRVGRRASLVYAPQPTMLYADAALRADLHAELEEDASLLLLDTWCAGRVHYGEAYRFRSYAAEVRIVAAGRLAAMNRLRLVPGEQTFHAPGVLERYTHCGTLYGFGPFADGAVVEAALDGERERRGGAPLLIGASLAARGGLVASALGHTAWDVHGALLAMARTIVHTAGRRLPPGCAPFVWPSM